MFLDKLKKATNMTLTENGALTYRSSLSDCLDMFFRAGASRNITEKEIIKMTDRAYAEDPDKTMKIIFFARDIRGGLGERRFFRTAMTYLADTHPESVAKNIPYIAEFGRYDDLTVLVDTECASYAIKEIEKQLKTDNEEMNAGRPVSLLAKWLPSVNASSAETVNRAKKICKMLKMPEQTYRHMLSKLRAYIDIIENRLRTTDYTFDYSKQPSIAMFKYRKAFLRNDKERYKEYLSKVEKGEEKINTGTLYPYEIIRSVLSQSLSDDEKRTLDLTWKSIIGDSSDSTGENALAVVDGSGSMYWGRGSVRPVDAAISLGMYFAEKNTGAFKNHFITFSSSPKLVEIKGRDIYEKVKYCSSFNEVANTNLEAVFDLILTTAVKNKMDSSELPSRLYIISDMEFDCCVTGGNSMPLFSKMKKRYEYAGYKLPEVVFWNVNSRNSTIPVTLKDTGAALVSGSSPSVFEMIQSGKISPEKVMNDMLMSERYKNICA